jgi:formylglycine-generating enzyme required for sulfatase activity
MTSSLRVVRRTATTHRFIESINGIPLEMVFIPGGTFLMGSPEDEDGRAKDNRESPQHEVTVTAFTMGRYPITQAQWKAVAALPQIDRTLKPDPSSFKGDDRPVERVNWYDATEFCARLARHTQRPYRLPSEAEWEYACRSGTQTPYSFGKTLTPELANFNNNIYETTPVGQFPANAWGLCDMHGNVYEWCADHWHENYENAPIDGRAWTEGRNDDSRILRGGSWYYNPRYCRSADRDGGDPDFDYDSFGFRVVCSAPGLS